VSILSGPEIVRLVRETQLWHGLRAAGSESGRPVPGIEIDPFDPDRAGPNSYDLTLGDRLVVYQPFRSEWVWPPHVPFGTQVENPRYYIDAREQNDTAELTVPECGLVLLPGVLYLGTTAERTRCDGLVPWIEGRSSVGRLGISVHATAGFGDDGVNLNWTLEISVVQPVKIYPKMRICQVAFCALQGQRKPYAGKYQNSTGVVPSRMWMDDDVK